MEGLGEILVYGYGSQLRSDDAVGPRVVEAVEALSLEGVRTLSRHQLTPELAEPISRARAVIFVDAQVAAPGLVVATSSVHAQPQAELTAHRADPGGLLALAEAVFGRCPPAWVVAIPVDNFDIGEELSPRAQRGLVEAVEQVRGLCERISGTANA